MVRFHSFPTFHSLPFIARASLASFISKTANHILHPLVLFAHCWSCVASGQGLCVLPDVLCFAGSAFFTCFWIAASHVLCPCCWALSSAMILKGTFSSFHPFRCYYSSQVIFVVQLELQMSFLPVFSSFLLVLLSHFSAVLRPLPWHPLFLWLNFSIALLCVKASQVKLHCPKASVVWVPAPIPHSKLSDFPFHCLPSWPRQDLHVSLWSDSAQVCLLAKEPCVCETAASSALPQSHSFRTFIHLFMWEHTAG